MISEGRVSNARHPLVVAEASETGRAALRAGIECAQRTHGRLSVVYVLRPQPPWWTGANPMACVLVPPQALSDIEIGERALAEARDEVPFDMPVCTQLLTARHGHRKEVLTVADALGCDAIIVPMSRRLFGFRTGLGAELARRSRLPVSLVERPSRNSAIPSGVRVADGPTLLEAIG
jgi:nucleotide-binding universal stress UspA family protein